MTVSCIPLESINGWPEKANEVEVDPKSKVAKLSESETSEWVG